MNIQHMKIILTSLIFYSFASAILSLSAFNYLRSCIFCSQVLGLYLWCFADLFDPTFHDLPLFGLPTVKFPLFFDKLIGYGTYVSFCSLFLVSVLFVEAVFCLTSSFEGVYDLDADDYYCFD